MALKVLIVLVRIHPLPEGVWYSSSKCDDTLFPPGFGGGHVRVFGTELPSSNRFTNAAHPIGCVVMSSPWRL